MSHGTKVQLYITATEGVEKPIHDLAVQEGILDWLNY